MTPYCVGANIVSAATYEAIIKQADASNNPAMKATKPTTQEVLNLVQQRKARLLAYLKPRITNMDVAPLLGAKEQGMDDQWKATNNACYPKCEPLKGDTQQKCFKSCDAFSEPYQHTRKCVELGFLPY